MLREVAEAVEKELGPCDAWRGREWPCKGAGAGAAMGKGAQGSNWLQVAMLGLDGLAQQRGHPIRIPEGKPRGVAQITTRNGRVVIYVTIKP